MKSKRHLIRIDDGNLQWMIQYRKVIGYNTPFAVLANMAIAKGQALMPMPDQQPNNNKGKK